MRICVVGDQHFRFEHSYASAIADGRKTEWEAVKQKIHETAATCDVVVLMGDNFNSRHNHSSVIREFIDFLKGFGNKPIHILVGNHEKYGNHTALDFLQRMELPNLQIYVDTRRNVQLGDVEATFIPYTTPAMLGVETKAEAQVKILDLPPADLLFAHHAITGTANTEFFTEIMLDKDILSKLFKISFGGHVHKPERISQNIIVTGNVFTQEVNEHTKFIWVCDTKTGMVDQVALPVRGIYKVTFADDSADAALTGIPDHSIVKAIVTNKQCSIEKLKEILKRFDASIVIEQYDDERQKVHFEEGGLDLSVEGLLKLYADTKGLSYTDVKEGFELIKN